MKLTFHSILTFLLMMAVVPLASGQEGSTSRRGSKIINDSSKNVYGPKTTLWFSEEDIFYNRKQFQPIDTTIANYHRWTYVQRLNNFYHDLGNMGTALHPVFPTLSGTPGLTSGFSAYDPYWKTQEPRYYDTKSPYTHFKLVWGGDGRATTDIVFSRNINKNWNFAFTYRPILVDKQIQRRRKGDRHVISHYYDFNTSYRSPNNRYTLLANYRRMRHRVFENGGIFLSENSRFESYFSQNAQPFLQVAQSEDLRSTGHVYHQYQLAKPFQVYQTIDVTKQKVGYSDDLAQEANDFYSQVLVSPGFDAQKISDGSFFRTFQSEGGIKGNAAFLFYNFYYRYRSISLYNRKFVGYSQGNFDRVTESYVGGRVALKYDSLNELKGEAEYLLDGNYRISGQLTSRWLDASLLSALSKPSTSTQAYRGSHHFWLNDFDNVFMNQASANLKAKVGRLEAKPGIRYTNLSQYIYYRAGEGLAPESSFPVQSSGVQQLMQPELWMQVRFLRHVYFRPHVIYTSVLQNDDDAIQVPELFVNAQLAYENTIAKGNLQVQAGVEVHWRSDYYTMGYDPAIQQFFVQRNFENPAYALADVFFAGKMKRGRFFFKYHNLQQSFRKIGYLTTPGYRGISNILDFGFDLFLFD